MAWKAFITTVIQDILETKFSVTKSKPTAKNGLLKLNETRHYLRSQGLMSVHYRH